MDKIVIYWVGNAFSNFRKIKIECPEFCDGMVPWFWSDISQRIGFQVFDDGDEWSYYVVRKQWISRSN